MWQSAASISVEAWPRGRVIREAAASSHQNVLISHRRQIRSGGSSWCVQSPCWGRQRLPVALAHAASGSGRPVAEGFRTAWCALPGRPEGSGVGLRGACVAGCLDLTGARRPARFVVGPSGCRAKSTVARAVLQLLPGRSSMQRWPAARPGQDSPLAEAPGACGGAGEAVGLVFLGPDDRLIPACGWGNTSLDTLAATGPRWARAAAFARAPST